jgi:transposase
MLSEGSQSYTHKTLAARIGTTESTVKFWLKDFQDCLPYDYGDRRQRILDERFVNFLLEVKRLRSTGSQGIALREALIPRLSEFGFDPVSVAADAVLVAEEPDDQDIVEVPKPQALYVLQTLGDRLEQTLLRMVDDRNLAGQFADVQHRLGVAETNAEQYRERYEEQRVRNLELREENQRLQERLAQLERHQAKGLLSRLFG